MQRVDKLGVVGETLILFAAVSLYFVPWLMALESSAEFTIYVIGTALSFFAVAITYSGIQITSQNSEAEREQVRVELRPYLIPDLKSVSSIEKGIEQFELRVMNAGKTPAKNIAIEGTDNYSSGDLAPYQYSKNGSGFTIALLGNQSEPPISVVYEDHFGERYRTIINLSKIESRHKVFSYTIE